MSIDLTQEQCQALLRGEAVRVSLQEGGEPVVLLREETYDHLRTSSDENDEDRRLRETFLQASHKAAVGWMKENPF